MRKRIDAILGWTLDNYYVIFLCAAIVYFLYKINSHSTLYLDKHEVFDFGFKTFAVVGVMAYLWGRKKAQAETIREGDIYADGAYSYAKRAFESKDYILAIVKSAEAVGALSGSRVCDCSAEHNLLAIALDKINHEHASAEHDSAVFYADKRNPNKVLYCFNAAVSYLKKNDWEFAAIRAQTGIWLTQENPASRFNQSFGDYDYATELRTIKIISSLRNYKGSKAFEIAKEDAAWIVANSKDEGKRKFAKNYLSATGMINKVADQITVDFLKEGAVDN